MDGPWSLLGAHDFVALAGDGETGSLSLCLCHRCCEQPAAVSCVACGFAACAPCGAEQPQWTQRHKCIFPKAGRGGRPSADGREKPGASRVINLPSSDQNRQYEHILNCIRELEAGVLDTAKSSHQYAAEVDSLSKLQPELEAAARQNLDLQQRLEVAQDKAMELERETSRQNRARGDILAQLQQALVREADLREQIQGLETHRDKIQNDLLESDGHRSHLQSKLERLMDQVKDLDGELADAREVKSELSALLRKAQDKERLQSSDILLLKQQLFTAICVARDMHFHVLPSQKLTHKQLADSKAKGIVDMDAALANLAVLLTEVKECSESSHRQSNSLDRMSQEMARAHARSEEDKRTLHAQISALQAEIEDQKHREAAVSEDLRMREQELLRLSDVKKMLTAANATIEGQASEIESLQSECSGLRNDIVLRQDAQRAAKVAAAADAEAVQALIDEAAGQLLHLEGVNVALQSKFEQLDAKASDLKSLVDRQTTRESELMAENQELRREIVGTRDQLHHITNECENATTLASSRETDVRRLQHSLSEAELSLADAEQTNKALENSVEVLMEETHGLENRAKTAEDNLVEMRLNAQTEAARLSAADETNRRNEAQILELQAEVQAKHIRVEELAARCSTIDQALEDHRKQIKEKSDACAELEKRLKVRQNKAAEMQKDIEALEDEVALQKQRSVDTGASAAEHKTANESLRRQLKLLTGDAQALREEVKQHDGEKNALAKLLAERDARIQELERQLKKSDTLRQETQKNEADKMRQLRKEMLNVSAENSDLHKQLGGKHSTVVKFEEELGKLKSQCALSDSRCAEAQKKLKSAEQDAEAQRQGCARTSKALSECSTKSASLEATNKKLQRQVEELSSQIKALCKKQAAGIEPAQSPQSPARVGLGVRMTDTAPHKITEVLDGGAAKASGKVKVGDTILTISGNDTRKLTFKQVKSLLIGPVGTSVELSLERKTEAGSKQVISAVITRGEEVLAKSNVHSSRPLSDTINEQLKRMQDASGIDLTSYTTASGCPGDH